MTSKKEKMNQPGSGEEEVPVGGRMESIPGSNPPQENEKELSLEALQDQLAELQAQVKSLQEKWEKAQSQADEYKDGWQRAVADFQNFKRRNDAERAETYGNAVGAVVKRYLPIMDDLERALKACPEGLAWAEGIELIYRKLQGILEAEGLKRIEAEGQPFDPNFHEAISKEPDENIQSGYVIAVVQNGYMMGDRVIRPAMVRVAQ